MTFEVTAIVAVVIFGVLAVYIIQAMIQLQKTLVETREMLAMLRRESAPLIHDVRGAVNEIRSVTVEARRAGTKIGIFVDSIQEVGEQLGQAQNLVKRASEAWYMGGRNVLSSLSAVAMVVGRKLQHNHGGSQNGK